MGEQAEQGKVDVRKALRVFQVMLDQGENIDGEYHFDGLKADPGIDGYSVTIRNDYVTLVVQFHSKFNLDYQGAIERDRFLDKLDKIDRHYGGRPGDRDA